MKTIFFFDIDTQRDFLVRGGAMYISGAERLIPKLRRLFGFAKANAITILSSINAHEPGDPVFGERPPCCVRGTEWQRKIDETLLLHPLVLENKPLNRSFPDLVRKHQQIIVEKQTFDVFSNPTIEKLIRVLPQRAILFGVPTEHSVQLAALGLCRLGIKTAVIQNATLAAGAREGANAEALMRKAGVEFITLEVLLGVQAED
jgi:nicotinamidase-related amidase